MRQKTTTSSNWCRRVRERVGDDFVLMADVGYRWSSPDEAIPIARRLDEFKLYALEAPFPPHDVDAYRLLADAIETPICTGDQLTSAVEYLPLLESGTISFVQGGAARTGMDDLHLLASRASELGKSVVTWGWVATGLTIAANLHVTVVHENMPFVEYAPPWLYPGTTMRNDLFGPEPEFIDGVFALPSLPGLGMNLRDDVLQRLRVD